MPGRARGFIACSERCAARHAGADQPQVSAVRAARRLPALYRARAARLRHLRVRDARRGQRCAEAGAATRRAGAGRTVQIQPDPVQSVPADRILDESAGADRGLPAGVAGGRFRRHGAQDAR